MTARPPFARSLSLAFGVLVAAGLVLGLALSLAAGPDAGPAVMVGARAPALRGTTLAGARYELRPSGHVTVVNIWAAWCAPCRQELPLVARAARAYRARGIQVVTVDTRDGPVAARALLDDTDARHLVVVSDPLGRLAVSWGATGVPETVVVDRRGIVRARYLGSVSRTWLDEQVRRWS